MLTRRRFLQSTALAGAALVVGFRLDGRIADAAETVFAPNAFVRITPDNVVTIVSKHIEMGQGSYTGLATILAEELDADWSKVRVEAAPADLLGYQNSDPQFRVLQATGGSTSIANSWEQLRWAGAKARAMLVAVAAREWGVDASEIVVDRSVVSHPSGRRATFGELVPKTAGTSEPSQASLRLKAPNDFKLVGKDVARLDRAAKTDGSATFTIDFTLPNTEMLTALIRRPPRFGARLKSFDATAARQVKGVTHVEKVPSGVAVVATGFWAARKGREALEVTWDEREAETRSSDQLYDHYRKLAGGPGKSARRVGDAERAIGNAVKVIEAVYEFPYLAHAPMEPLDAVARIGRDGCDVWTGSQFPTIDRIAAAKAARMLLSLRRVRVHTLMAGGSFGRRATPNGEVAAEASAVARAINDPRPVKVVWTREDDIQGGRYRPLYVHRLRAGLDAQGDIVGWEHHIVGQSILKESWLTDLKVFLVDRNIDPTSVEGAAKLPYAVRNVSVELHPIDDVRVPVLWWRSVGHTHNAFVTETFLDECLIATGRDPVKERLRLLAAKPRHRATLVLAAEKAGWTEDKGWEKPLPAGRARGIAVHESFKTVVETIAEDSHRPDGLPKVERVVCAVDCGRVINPDIVKAQMQGGIGFGLGAALWNEITIEEGRPKESNFDDYRPLRMEDMPAVEVYIVASDAAPTGVGEPGVPPIGPAVANAFAALTGRRVRRLPFARLTAAGTRTV